MSMWEPRSSHLYVCTGLRVWEWLCVWAWGRCDFCPYRGQSDTKCKCQCVPWRVGVYACFMHICERAPSAPFSALLSVCLKYMTVCCLLLCLACEWARVHIGN